MSQAGVLAVRALAGGTLVVVCALAGELLRPKSFAGILAAAPSVALASLSVTLLARGEPAVRASAVGMVAGAVAMVAACVVGVEAVRRVGAMRGSLASLMVWAAVASCLYVATLR